MHSIGKKSQEYIELEEEFCENETSRSEQDAENFAIGALATRALTAVELQKKLRAKKFAPSVIDKVMKGLQDKGLVNDGLYAEIYSQSRWSSSTWGPKRIKQALYRKGVSEVDANKATKYVFEDSGSGENGEQNVLGMSKVSMDRLFSQTSKQWLRSQNVEYEKRKSRIIRIGHGVRHASTTACGNNHGLRQGCKLLSRLLEAELKSGKLLSQEAVEELSYAVLGCTESSRNGYLCMPACTCICINTTKVEEQGSEIYKVQEPGISTVHLSYEKYQQRGLPGQYIQFVHMRVDVGGFVPSRYAAYINLFAAGRLLEFQDG
ncbi:hypothetical protein IFM89_035757 [Coptis chinensis]|uniref:Regulatory protein RecX n=1 Tax=Coptis chinensis TaxID=261450 RepID=A0A835LKJ5_9MAGN|nr:hypothetical protein IFM89_035757 [Coptis chinensis]